MTDRPEPGLDRVDGEALPSSGARLKAIRDELGLTQQELGDRLGYSREAVANAERGAAISTSYLRRFAEHVPEAVEKLADVKPTAQRTVIRSRGRDLHGDLRRTGVIAVYPSQDEAEVEIAERAEAASCIDVLAIRGLGITALSESLLRPVLAAASEPKTLRILFLRPESRHTAARAGETKEAESAFRKGIELGIERVEELRRNTNHAIDLRLYDQLPVWRILKFDDVMFVSTYCPDWEGQSSQMLQVVKTGDGALYAALLRVFDSIFVAADVLQPAKG